MTVCRKWSRAVRGEDGVGSTIRYAEPVLHAGRTYQEE